MMRSTLPSLIATCAFATAGLVGCEGDTTSAVSDAQVDTDEQAIGLLIQEDGDSFGVDVEMNDRENLVEAERQVRDGDNWWVDEFAFRRIIRSQDLVREVVFEDPADGPPTASVSIIRDMHGIFRLFFRDPDQAHLTSTLDKRLEATAKRNARFVRRDGLSRHRNWILTDLSGVEITSEGSSKVIQSIELSAASGQYLITDPLELVPVAELPRFQTNEEIIITVTTNDDTDVVFLHGPYRKFDLEPMGGGVFQGSWRTGDVAGRHRAAVDVIDHDTLFVDDAPYDSTIWGFVYGVVGLRGSDTTLDPVTDGGDTGGTSSDGRISG